jgi:hypothetical protein
VFFILFCVPIFLSRPSCNDKFGAEKTIVATMALARVFRTRSIKAVKLPLDPFPWRMVAHDANYPVPFPRPSEEGCNAGQRFL